MLSRIVSRRPVAGSIVLIAFAASAAGAQAADITLTDAKIEAGFLVIAGTTATPNTQVRLDGQTEAAFNVTSNASRVFGFSIVYHPGDCIVTLQRVLPPFATLGEPTNGLVADCGPAGVSPRGAWSEAMAYVRNDLVTYLGSTWRARRNNAGREPVAGADWEQFAAAGGPAPEGPAGATEQGKSAAENLRAPPDGPAGGDLTGEYPDPTIRNQSVDTAAIALGAVTTVRINDLAVTPAKIANDAVTTPKIADGAINSAKIADGAIATIDIGDGAVTNLQIADGAVDGAAVLDSSLTANDLGAGSVGSSEILNDAVGATEIVDGAIDSGEIVDESLTSDDFAAASVGASELINGSVTGTDIADSTITGGDVANNSLTLSDVSGANVNGTIGLAANAVANGRCKDFTAGTPGAAVGDAVVVSLKGALPEGILIYGVRVATAGTAILKVCNFSGAAMAAISNLQIRTVSFN